jgi:hypothetical protein
MAGYLLTNEMTVGLAVDYQYTKYTGAAAYNLYGLDFLPNIVFVSWSLFCPKHLHKGRYSSTMVVLEHLNSIMTLNFWQVLG